MSLLKELKTLREGAVKEKLMDIIDNAINKADTGDATYLDAIKMIAKYARDHDHEEILNGLSDTELRGYIADQVDEEDMMKEDEADTLNVPNNSTTTVPAPAPTNNDQPRLIKSVPGFKLMASNDSEQITLQDVGGKVIVQMPTVVWKQLTGAV